MGRTAAVNGDACKRGMKRLNDWLAVYCLASYRPFSLLLSAGRPRLSRPSRTESSSSSSSKAGPGRLTKQEDR